MKEKTLLIIVGMVLVLLTAGSVSGFEVDFDDFLSEFEVEVSDTVDCDDKPIYGCFALDYFSPGPQIRRDCDDNQCGDNNQLCCLNEDQDEYQCDTHPFYGSSDKDYACRNTVSDEDRENNCVQYLCSDTSWEEAAGDYRCCTPLDGEDVETYHLELTIQDENQNPLQGATATFEDISIGVSDQNGIILGNIESVVVDSVTIKVSAGNYDPIDSLLTSLDSTKTVNNPNKFTIPFGPQLLDLKEFVFSFKLTNSSGQAIPGASVKFNDAEVNLLPGFEEGTLWFKLLLDNTSNIAQSIVFSAQDYIENSFSIVPSTLLLKNTNLYSITLDLVPPTNTCGVGEFSDYECAVIGVDEYNKRGCSNTVLGCVTGNCCLKADQTPFDCITHPFYNALSGYDCKNVVNDQIWTSELRDKNCKVGLCDHDYDLCCTELSSTQITQGGDVLIQWYLDTTVTPEIRMKRWDALIDYKKFLLEIFKFKFEQYTFSTTYKDYNIMFKGIKLMNKEGTRPIEIKNLGKYWIFIDYEMDGISGRIDNIELTFDGSIISILDRWMINELYYIDDTSISTGTSPADDLFDNIFDRIIAGDFIDIITELGCNNQPEYCHEKSFKSTGRKEVNKWVDQRDEYITCFNDQDPECTNDNGGPNKDCFCFDITSYGECTENLDCKNPAKNNESKSPCKCGGKDYTTDNKPYCYGNTGRTFNSESECVSHKLDIEACGESDCQSPSKTICANLPCSDGAGTCNTEGHCVYAEGLSKCESIKSGGKQAQCVYITNSEVSRYRRGINITEGGFKNFSSGSPYASNNPPVRCYDGNDHAGGGFFRFPNSNELKGHTFDLTKGLKSDISWEEFQLEYIGETDGKMQGKGEDSFRYALCGTNTPLTQCCVYESVRDVDWFDSFFGPIDPKTQWLWDKLDLQDSYEGWLQTSLTWWTKDLFDEDWGWDDMWSLEGGGFGNLANYTDLEEYMCDIRLGGRVDTQSASGAERFGSITLTAQGDRSELLPDSTYLYDISWTVMNERGSEGDINVTIFVTENGTSCDNDEDPPSPVRCKIAMQWDGKTIKDTLLKDDSYIHGLYPFYYNDSIIFEKICILYGGNETCVWPIVDETYDAPDPGFEAEEKETEADEVISEGGWIQP